MYLTPSETKKIKKTEEKLPRKSLQGIRALSSIVMELMQGYAKEGGAVGVDNLDRWSASAVSFLSDTVSAASAEELAKVCCTPSLVPCLIILASLITTSLAEGTFNWPSVFCLRCI